MISFARLPHAASLVQLSQELMEQRTLMLQGVGGGMAVQPHGMAVQPGLVMPPQGMLQGMGLPSQVGVPSLGGLDPSAIPGLPMPQLGAHGVFPGAPASTAGDYRSQ